MKNIILIALSFYLISCDKTEELEKKDIVGNWILIAKESLTTNSVEIYPDAFSSKIELDFSQDSVKYFGCNRLLGEGNYSLEKNDKLSITGFTYIEPCSLNGWIETIANCLVHSAFFELTSDTLKITTDNLNGDYQLSFLKN